MRKRFYIISLLLLFLNINLFSNNYNKVDSLLNLLKTATVDSQKVKILHELSYNVCETNYLQSIEYASNALEISKTNNYKKGAGLSYFALGRSNESKGEYQKAISNFFLALQIFEEIDDKVDIAKTLSYIGFIYRYQSNIDNAIVYQQKSLEIYKKLNDKDGIATSLVNIGNCYISKNELEKAIKFYQEGLKYFIELKNDGAMASTYNNIGAVYYEQTNYKIAVDYFIMAYKIREKLNDKYGIATSLNNIGETYGKLGNYNLGIDYCYKSLEISKVIDAKDIMLYTYENLAWLHSSKGDNYNAYKFMHLNSLYKDSVFSVENNKQINELSVKFETERKENEIKILIQKNEIQDLEVSHQRLIKNAFIFGFLLILALSFLIYNRYKVKKAANKLLEVQKQEITIKNSELNIANQQIEAKNKDITDSIKYAKRIQEAILPRAEFRNVFKENGFIFYKPKDIVSGDFYWMSVKGNRIFLAAVDCTGHGVPGAFMSIVGHNLLNQAVNEHNITLPSEILNEVNVGITNTLRQYELDSAVKDGMDIALCVLNKDTLELQYAGAYNPLWIIKKGIFSEIKADKFPIGAFVGEKMNKFSNNIIQLEQGDLFYLFTDGYADQFGGPNGKKFKYKQLQELLLKNASKTLQEQKLVVESAFNQWIGVLEQIDDVLVIGIKV